MDRSETPRSALDALAQLGVPEDRRESLYSALVMSYIILTRGCLMALLVWVLNGGRYLPSITLWLLHDSSVAVPLLRDLGAFVTLDDDFYGQAEFAELVSFFVLMTGYTAAALVLKAIGLIFWLAWIALKICWWALALVLRVMTGRGSDFEIGFIVSAAIARWILLRPLPQRLATSLTANLAIGTIEVVERIYPELRRLILYYGDWSLWDLYHWSGDAWGRLSAIRPITSVIEDCEKYQYRPLDAKKREIRLLVIQRRVPFIPVRCNMIHVSLDDEPKYEAMSYVWGNPTRTHLVRVDGKVIPITESVRGILEQKASISGPKKVWIDAVCINQEDIEEKPKQIQMMLDIYRSAKFVTVNLGEAPDADLVPIFLDRISMNLVMQSDSASSESLYHMYMAEYKENNWVQPPRWLALLRLFQNPWFERVWVVQELAAARSVRMVYGRRNISFPKLSGLIFALMLEHGSELRIAVTRINDTQTTTMPAAFRHAPMTLGYRNMFQRGRRLEFHMLLRSLLSMKATEPVDKIFALLGLSDAAGNPDLPIIYGDNARPTVLMNTAYYFMRRPEALPVMQLAGIGWPHSEVDIPSWVVDWTKSVSTYLISLSALELDKNQYNATRRAARNLICTRGSPQISISGRVVGSLSTVYHALTEEATEYDAWGVPALSKAKQGGDWLRYLRTLEEAAMQVPEPYPTGQPITEVIWRTIIADRGSDGARPAAPDYAMGFEDLKESVLRRYLETRGAEWGRKTGGLLRPDEEAWMMNQENSARPLKLKMEAAARFNNAIGNAASNRAFAISEEGYVGLVPPKAEPGDLICLLYGGDVPFLLRPRNSPRVGDELITYSLVGESYFHGMMDGEMMDMEFQSEVFEIW